MPNNLVTLDRVFHSLSNPTRREVVERLALGPSSMTELASTSKMALPSFLQHLQVMEKAGIIRSQKLGRVRTFELERPPILLADTWLDAQRRKWDSRLDQLDQLLSNLKDIEHD